MKMSKLFLGVALVMGLTLGLSGSAFAVAITCGGCHGSAPLGNPVNGDNCTNNARGLHGTHVNYSSAVYKKTITANGKCSYCHAAVADAKGISSRTHNNNFINVTGNLVNTLDVRTMSYNAATKTCTNSCHKNRAETAKWGNYTATVVGNIKLSCRACHDDYQDKTGLSGKHNTHLLVNTTTTGGLLNGASNTACNTCHPDASGDIAAFKAAGNDNGVVDAYGHASDGTNVVADNAALSNGILTAVKAGANTTCTTNCHPRSNATVNWNTPWAQAAGTGCDMCHYWSAAPLDTANTGTGALSAGHNPHLKSGMACITCHPTHVTASYDNHGGRLPAVGYNAKVVKAGMTYNLPAKTCSGTGASGCHGALTTTAWGPSVAGCAACHKYPGAAIGQGDWAAGNGHFVRYGAPVVNTHLGLASGYATTDVFLTVANDAAKCGKCHLSTGHNNGTIDRKTVNGGGMCGGDFTFIGTAPNTQCGSAKCHSGKTTPIWY
jgi:hypothetical protein